MSAARKINRAVLGFALSLERAARRSVYIRAAAVQGRSGRGQARSGRFHIQRGPGRAIYTPGKDFMDWGNFVRSSAVGIGLAAVVVAAIYLATRFLLLLEAGVAP
jgi:hypothetical protein